MTVKLLIAREVFRNLDSREYHTNFLIVRERILRFDFQDYEEYSDWKKLSDDLRGLLQALFSLEGVITVWLHPYHLGIQKAPLFEWGEIDGRVIELLKGFSKKPDEVEIQDMPALPAFPEDQSDLWSIEMEQEEDLD